MSDSLKRFAGFLAEWAAEPQTSDAQTTRPEPVEDLDALDAGPGPEPTREHPGGSLSEASVARPRPVLHASPVTDSRPRLATKLDAFNPQAVAARLSQQLDAQNARSAAYHHHGASSPHARHPEEPSGAPLEASPPMPVAPGISGPVTSSLAEWQQRECHACGALRPFYGFGPPLSRTFVWACDEHRQQVEAELEAKRRA